MVENTCFVDNFKSQHREIWNELEILYNLTGWHIVKKIPKPFSLNFWNYVSSGSAYIY